MEEIEKIKKRYERRNSILIDKNWYYGFWVQCEREFWYLKILKKKYSNFKYLKLLEIGAGVGSNLNFFHRIGFKFENLFANELLLNRGQTLKENVPTSNIFICNALELEFKENFDIVFQSTVFTSILDYNFKMKLAEKMWDMTKKGGIVLWYDFVYDNPKNKDVKGINRNEIRKLFPEASSIYFSKVTLAPPIGRKVGNWYNIINFLFPFFRTHQIAVIQK